MKKLVLVSVSVLLIVVAAGFFVFRSISAQDSSAAEASDVSKRTALVLQAKIDDIKRTESAPPHPGIEVSVTEAELESYVLFELREKIPVQMDSISVQLTPGAIAAETQLTFTSNGTGNPIFDSLVGGTHNLYVKGRLTGADSLGKFDLEEVRVDGIPVPKVLIQTIVDKYVKPKYPDVDLKAPFELPWGIRAVDIQTHKAKIVY